MFTGDRHIDSTKSNRPLQKEHLELVKERGAALWDNGDLFDAMGGRNDPRGHKGGIRAEHHVPNYFDVLAQDAAEFLSPYADNIIGLAMGNHETAVLQKVEVNLTERVVGLLNAQTNSTIYNGGYSGWITFAFEYDNGSGGRGPRTHHISLFYHHGSSSGKSSSNIAAHEKMAAYLPDADIIVTSHAHNFWSDWVARMRLSANANGGTYHDHQLHLGIASYKDDIGIGRDGWAVEKGFRPKVPGGWWLRFFYSSKASRVMVEAIAAK